jgi:hypothetical protein
MAGKIGLYDWSLQAEADAEEEVVCHIFGKAR